MCGGVVVCSGHLHVPPSCICETTTIPSTGVEKKTRASTGVKRMAKSTICVGKSVVEEGNQFIGIC